MKNQGNRSATTVVGVGNEMRRDDGAGLKVLDGLKRKSPPGARSDINLVRLDGDQLCVLEIMKSTETMIIVDAARSQSQPGTIFQFDWSNQEIPPGMSFSSTHGFNPLDLIHLARSLKILPRQVTVYGITGKDFSYGRGLTPQVRDAVRVIVDRITDNIRCLSSVMRPSAG